MTRTRRAPSFLGRRPLVAGLGGVVILIMIAIVAIDFFLNHSAMARGAAERALAGVLGRTVQVSTLSVGLGFPPTVRLRSIVVGQDPQRGRHALFTIDEADVALRFAALLRGHIEPSSVTLKAPQLTLTRDEDPSSATVSIPSSIPAVEPAPAEQATGLAGTSLAIDSGLIVYGTEAPQLGYRLENVNLTGQIESSLALIGNAQFQPGNVAVQIIQASLPLAGGPPLRDAPVRARATIATPDVHDLAAAVIGPSPILGGALNGTINFSGALGGLEAAGDLHVPTLTVDRAESTCASHTIQPLTFKTVSVDAAWHDGRLTGEPATARLDGGSVSVNLAADPRATPPHLALNGLVVTGVPLEPLLVGFFCAGYAVTGTLALDGNLSWVPGDASRTMEGFGQIQIGAGEVVGPQALDLLATIARVGGAVSSLLSLDLPLSLFYSPLDFNSITGRYEIAHGVVHVHDLLYDSTAMKIAASGDYQIASGTLNLQMIVNHGRGEVLATVAGPAAAPSVHVTPTTILRELNPATLEHGLRSLLDQIP